MKSWFFLLLLLAIGSIPAPARMGNMNYVVATPDGPTDGGDFGPNTPGTLTCGLQEAFNYAVQQGRDVYIAGGAIAATSPSFVQDSIYFLGAPLVIPSNSNWKIDCGNAVINYDLGDNGPVVSIDSQQNSSIRLPLVVATALALDGIDVLVQPKTALADGVARFSDSTLAVQAVVGGGNVYGAAQGYGTGVSLDSSYGAITGNDFFIHEPNACQTGIMVSGTQAIEDNLITSPFDHLCNYALDVKAGTHNRYRIYTTAPPNTPSIGTYVEGGSANYFEIAASSQNANSDLILTANTHDNVVLSMAMPDGFTDNGTNDVVLSLNSLP